MIFSRTLHNKTTVFSEYLNEEIVDLLGNTFQIPPEYNYEVVQVDPGYEARPDLVSYEIYDDDFYSDILLKLNGPSNPFELNDNYIIVPTMDYVDEFHQIPSKLWDSQKTYKPKPKARNAKRKPNEAIVGDKRFNIDSNSKIVIY